MNRAVIYVRVSSREQAEGGYSIEAQLEACRRFVYDKGWTVEDEFSELGESARTVNRPAFKAMAAMLDDHGGITHLVVHKIDRLARNLADYAAVKARLQKLGMLEQELADEVSFSAESLALARRRLVRAEHEREKLLQAYFAEALPLDLFKREQNRIAKEIDLAQAEIKRTEATDSPYGQLLETALGIDGSLSSTRAIWPARSRSAL